MKLEKILLDCQLTSVSLGPLYAMGFKQGGDWASRQTLANVVTWLEEHNWAQGHLPSTALRLSTADWQALKKLVEENKA